MSPPVRATDAAALWAATGASVRQLRWRVAADWSPIPPHRHLTAIERLEILDGAIEASVDGWRRIYRAGESLIVPAGAVHRLLPVPRHGVELLWQRPFGPWITVVRPTDGLPSGVQDRS